MFVLTISKRRINPGEGGGGCRRGNLFLPGSPPANSLPLSLVLVCKWKAQGQAGIMKDTVFRPWRDGAGPPEGQACLISSQRYHLTCAGGV